MLIYWIIKIFFEYIVYYFKLSYLRYVVTIFEIIIIYNFLFIFLRQEIIIFWFLLYWCIFFILLVFFFKILNYILVNFEKIISWIESKKKIKSSLLNPKVNKIIYYLVWSLPWNLPYWIYFYLMENGWYFRVWLNSNRDIILYKYLGWDSRNFFFKMNKILFENFVFLLLIYVKDEIIRCILRLVIIMSWFRTSIIKISFFEYIVHRIFVFCYLSLFYLYFFVSIQIINMVIVFLFIMCEALILISFGYIYAYLILSKNKYILNFNDLLSSVNAQLLADPLTYKYFIPARSFFEVNNQVWNIILGDSISLNILKQYMLWVNKNTKGYYYKEMNILPKYNIVKLFEISSIPFDILPRTRYVIMNLRSISYNIYKDSILKTMTINMPDYRIKNMKNLYLSYFEKTYAVDSSLLSIIFLLRMNFPINYVNVQESYKGVESVCSIIINYIMMYQKSALWRLRLAEINKANPELFNICYLLNSFKVEKQLYDIEYFFMTNFFGRYNITDKVPKIKEVGSIKEYKENIKLLAHFVLYEEEGIVWNPDVINYLNMVSNSFVKNREFNVSYFSGLNKFNQKLETFITLREELWGNQSVVVDEVINFYGFVLNRYMELHKIIFLPINDISHLNLFVLKIGFYEKYNKGNDKKFLLLSCEAIVQDLETISLYNFEGSRYSFLFE